MLKNIYFLFAIILLSCTTIPMDNFVNSTEITWQTWSEEIFAKAKKENRLIILDLKAVWCHWCHVMDDTTYKDGATISIINKYYIPVRVDQDSNPSLANRYRAYGWPATIIFNAEGQELVKNRGYIDPEEMQTLLLNTYKNPVVMTTKKAVTYNDNSNLSEELRQELKKRYQKTYDKEKGGLQLAKRFLDIDTLEYALTKNDSFSQELVTKTLAGTSKLIDPVWGGMYQYSTHSDWEHPHYEKIMSSQVRAVKAYTIASRVVDAKYQQEVEKITTYIGKFLTDSSGAFYTSQDADVIPGQKSSDYFALNNEERLKQGIPRIDKNIYARENGWVIEAFTIIYAFGLQMSRATTYLDKATIAAEWILANRRNKNGFIHTTENLEKYYLGDNLAMASAFLQLYTVTAQRKWLQHAQETADFIITNFKAEQAGFYTENFQNAVIEPILDLDENIQFARFTNNLYHYTRDNKYKEAAEHTFKYLSTYQIATQRLSDTGILLADQELNNEPPHVTIVGDKNDPLAQKLFRTAVNFPIIYKVVEWYDPVDGALPNAKIEFPVMDTAVAFICAGTSCSAPIDNVSELNEALKEETK